MSNIDCCAPSTSATWTKLLQHARSGSILTPPVGELGSLGWRIGDAIPRTIILCDLKDPTPLAQVPDFPPEFYDVVEELDLSGNGIKKLPESVTNLKMLKCLLLGGHPPNQSDRKNVLHTMPSLSSLIHLQHLSVHDTDLQVLPSLPPCLQTLRVDRCPLQSLPATLPLSLTTLHLEGCPLPGTYDRPDLLPNAVQQLVGLLDLQLPDGSHMGIFFGTPLGEMLSQTKYNEVDDK